MSFFLQNNAFKFTLWSPNATAVELLLYDEPQGGAVVLCLWLKSAAHGWWQGEVERSCEGMFYTFRVHIGNRVLPETPDPAAVAVGVNGQRGAIIDLRKTDPEGWQGDVRPPYERRPVVYELHHRDFSISHASGIQNKGRFLALTEQNTTSPDGLATGLAHLKELGVTHVQMLPSFDFASIDERQPMVPHYNWGYDPQNYNVPEGSYATDATQPMVRIREFKQMVQALHQAGIRVVLDVVYNHVASVADSVFERTAPGRYFRYNADGTLANGSGCGNETASECHAMRQFMVDSVTFWAREYHIDGFRFDLMALHDHTTMQVIVNTLLHIDPTICVYGEGWAAQTPRLHQHLSMDKRQIHLVPQLSAFGDELRDALRGPFYNDSQGGFLLGDASFIDDLKLGLVGAVAHPQLNHIQEKAWAQNPMQMMAYVSCHDDLCLYDRLLAAAPTLTADEALRLSMLAHTAVLVSQGVPFIFAGEEMLRTKRGVRNSYRSPDGVNAIDWRNKSKYFSLFTYLRRLIALRRKHRAFQLAEATLVRSLLRFIDLPRPSCAVAFTINCASVEADWQSVVVVLNAEAHAVEVPVPFAHYRVLCQHGAVHEAGLAHVATSCFAVSPQSALIAVVLKEQAPCD
ncbi:MAG: type I pullulanase [Bacteroidaceae bacterium]|nr:type I pullulanase [Bacteroidaceae bacterium]